MIPGGAPPGGARTEGPGTQHKSLRGFFQCLGHAHHIRYRVLAVAVGRDNAVQILGVLPVPGDGSFDGRPFPPVLGVMKNGTALKGLQRGKDGSIVPAAAVVHYRHRPILDRKQLGDIIHQGRCGTIGRDYNTTGQVRIFPFQMLN